MHYSNKTTWPARFVILLDGQVVLNKGCDGKISAAINQDLEYYIFCSHNLVGWLVVLSINIDLVIFQPYLDLEAGDNQSLKIQVARPGIEARSSCFASQELNHSAAAAPRVII